MKLGRKKKSWPDFSVRPAVCASLFRPAARSPRVLRLEQELQGELDNAWVNGGLVDLAKVRRVHVWQEQRAADGERTGRVGELSMVERVVKLRTELQHFTF